MKRSRIIYLFLMVIVIALGLLSRRIAIIPAGVGDMLWAVMMFLMIRFLLPSRDILQVTIISLAICFLVEVSQLYHETWIDQIRSTTLGALALGRGFLWSDLLAYTIGILICFITEKLFQFRK